MLSLLGLGLGFLNALLETLAPSFAPPVELFMPFDFLVSGHKHCLLKRFDSSYQGSPVLSSLPVEAKL